MSTYDEVISKDIELLKSINNTISFFPRFHNFLAKVVSKNPMKDVVLVLWFFFVFGMFEVGIKHFWVVAMNFCLAIPLRMVIEAKRPYEYDVKLKPKTDLSPDSYGFPSLESYMSVVIMGHLFFHLNSIYFLPIAIVVIAVVGISRIYSRSRFPHQIIGSYFLGFLGLIVSMQCCDKIAFHEMSHHDHGFCVGAVVILVLSGLGLNMENNQSHFLYIPKQEFIRVMVDILSGGGKGVSENDKNEEEYDENEQYDDNVLYDSSLINTKRSVSSNSTATSSNTSRTTVKESPRSAAMKQAQSISGNSLISRKKHYVKSDSLFYLQKALEDREARIQSEILLLDPNHNLAAKTPGRKYGTEDFFSSDSEDDYVDS